MGCADFVVCFFFLEISALTRTKQYPNLRPDQKNDFYGKLFALLIVIMLYVMCVQSFEFSYVAFDFFFFSDSPAAAATADRFFSVCKVLQMAQSEYHLPFIDFCFRLG